MPSDKKRVNLTIPDDIYERLQAYKTRYGIPNDASACLQLVVQQLNGLEKAEAILNFVQNNTLEQLNEISQEGLATIKDIADNR